MSNKELADKLKDMADNAYCAYIQQMRQPRCLGYEAKLAAGEFGKDELDAHTRAGELLGRHRGLAEAAWLIREQN